MADLASMSKLELEDYAKAQFDVDLARNLSKANMIREIEAMTKAKAHGESDATPAPSKPAKAKGGLGSLEPRAAETLVQLAGAFLRERGEPPEPGELALATGLLEVEDVDKALRDEACKQALARSGSLDPAEIVAKAMWP